MGMISEVSAGHQLGVAPSFEIIPLENTKSYFFEERGVRFRGYDFKKVRFHFYLNRPLTIEVAHDIADNRIRLVRLSCLQIQI